MKVVFLSNFFKVVLASRTRKLGLFSKTQYCSFDTRSGHNYHRDGQKLSVTVRKAGQLFESCSLGLLVESALKKLKMSDDEDDDDILFFDSGSDEEVGDPSNPMDQELMMNSLSEVQYYFSDDENDPKITPGHTPSPQVDQKMPKPRDPFDLDSEEEVTDEELVERYELLKKKFLKLLSTFNNLRFEADEFRKRAQELREKRDSLDSEVETLGEMRYSLLNYRERSKVEIMKSVIRDRTGQAFIPMKEIEREKTFDERMKDVDFNRRNREVTALHARLIADFTKVQDEVNAKLAIHNRQFGEEKRKNDLVRREIQMLNNTNESKITELRNCESTIESLKEGMRLLQEQVMGGTRGALEEKEDEKERHVPKMQIMLKEKKMKEVKKIFELQEELKKASFERNRNRKTVLQVKKMQNRKLSQLQRRMRSRDREIRRRRWRRMMGIGKVMEAGRLDWDGRRENTSLRKSFAVVKTGIGKESSLDLSKCLEEMASDSSRLKDIVEGEEVLKTIDAVGIGIREKIRSLRESTIRT